MIISSSSFPRIRILIIRTTRTFNPLNFYTSLHHHLQLLTPIRPISTNQIYTYNVEIGSLVRAGKIKAARQLFDKMPERDVVSWNAIVTGYWQNGFLEESKRLFELMPVRNIVSWNSMIAGCVENERIEEACEYFYRMPKRNTASWNAMISGFVKYSRIDEASKLFDEMPQKNVISYTAMIDGFAQNGEVEKARALFDRVPKRNAVSWTVMISGYVENEKFDEAKALFDLMPEKNVVAITAMITGYCKEGKIENARILFDGIHHKDLVSWNAMIAGYAQNGNGEEALILHLRMLEMGMKPDHATLISVLTACCSLASLREGRQTHAHVSKNGFESNTSVCNTLITMYSKCGSIRDSEAVFQAIESPDIVSWNTIIAGYAQHGRYEKAMNSFYESGVTGLKPDGVTFLSVLSACGHAGKVMESLEWFRLMVTDYEVVPRAEHYSCMVDILSRAGELEKAYEIIQEMPFEPDSGVWGAILAACRVYRNVEFGELAAKKLVKLDPRNSGAYIMLSNIYAAAGMWSEVKKVRGLMKEHGVKKQPGYSWTEIGNKVHVFLGGDISHPEIDEIHSELGRIGMQMKTADYIGDISLA